MTTTDAPTEKKTKVQQLVELVKANGGKATYADLQPKWEKAGNDYLHQAVQAAVRDGLLVKKGSLRNRTFSLGDGKPARKLRGSVRRPLAAHSTSRGDAAARVAARPIPPAGTTPDYTLNGCPCCMANLVVTRDDLEDQRRAMSYCPSCGVDLARVAAVLPQA
jgi:hypothetical protein